ncbi:MAG: hypothetical protein WBE86_00925 [Candidatus Acidiferrales bacterium]
MMQRSEVVQKICDVVAAECNRAFGDRVVALILTGSAARVEATILNAADGWKLSSDAEFLLVVQRTAESGDTKATNSVKQESAKKLRSQGIEVSLDLAVVLPSYLQALPPHIFSYELRSCGKVIAGDPSVLDLIPKFAAQKISREDAWRLLCNRMIEQLEFVDDLENSTVQLTSRLSYASVKLYLDMATSYLVFAGHYAPTYRERADRLSTLASQPNEESPFPLTKFAARVAECTSWKLSGDEESCDRGVEFWHEAISYMRRLWRWEMIQLTHASGELTIASLTNQLAEQQTSKQRFRGWMSVVKRYGWVKSCAQWPRWVRLSSRSTPRYLVYQVAAEIAFRLPCLIKHNGQPPRLDVNWRQLRGLLPARLSERAPHSNSQGKAAWRKLVDDVLWNYSEFLRSTRA